MAVSGLLGRAAEEDKPGKFSDWRGTLQRVRPADDSADPNMIVLPPDIGTLFYPEQDISPQWDQDMTKVAKASRTRGAI